MIETEFEKIEPFRQFNIHLMRAIPMPKNGCLQKCVLAPGYLRLKESKRAAFIKLADRYNSLACGDALSECQGAYARALYAIHSSFGVAEGRQNRRVGGVCVMLQQQRSAGPQQQALRVPG